MARETAIKAGLALVGADLEVERDLCITIDEGMIVEISRGSSCPLDHIGGPDIVVTPQPGLAHTHSGDHAFPEYGVEEELSRLVAPPHGLKHKKLQATPQSRIEDAITEYYRLAWRYGVGLLIDFREGGGEGCSLSKRAVERTPEGLDVIVLGRPGPGFPDGCDGLGLSSPLDYDIDRLVELVRSLRPAFTHVAETRAARLQGDLERALEAGFDAVIHGTHLSDSDLELLAEKEVALILCPRSNLWHGLGIPPVREALSRLDLVGLGSDNASWMPPDPWREAEAAMLLARLKGPSGEWLADKILKSVYVVPYGIVGMRPKIVEEGAPANMLLFDASDTGILRAESVKYGLVKRIGRENIVARVDRGEVSFV